MRWVLLHGLAGEPDDWREVSRLTANCGQAPRLSVAPAVDYFDGGHETLEAMAEAAWNALPEAYRDGRACVAGNSLGGVLALILAERFRRVALVSSFLETSTGFVGRGPGAVRRELTRIFHNRAALTPERVAGYEAKWRSFSRSRERFSRLRRLKSLVTSFDPAPWYAGQQGRITLVCGREDGISPLERFEDLRSRYPAMGLEVVEDCGHAVPLERPERLAEILCGLG